MAELSVSDAIERLIQVARTGKVPEREERHSLFAPIYEVARKKGKLRNYDWRVRYWGDETFPRVQTALLAAENLGLVKKKEHREFMGRYNVFLRLENTLEMVRHRIGTKPFEELARRMEGKPLEERMTFLGIISRPQMDKITKIELKMLKERNPDKHLELIKQFNLEVKSLGMQVEKGLLEMGLKIRRGAKTNEITKMRKIMSSKSEGSESQWPWSSREKDVIARYLEALEGKKPTRSARGIQRPWSISDRGTSIDFSKRTRRK